MADFGDNYQLVALGDASVAQLSHRLTDRDFTPQGLPKAGR